MEFYPYRLYISEQVDAVFDENGFAEDNMKDYTLVSNCRDYASGGGSVSQAETKEIVNFSSIICLPLSCPKIEPNTPIQVKDRDGNVRLMGNVIRFERNQLHCRIWV